MTQDAAVIVVCDGDFGRFDRVLTRVGDAVQVFDPAAESVTVWRDVSVAEQLGAQLRTLYGSGRARRGQILVVSPGARDVELLLAAAYVLEGWRISRTDPFTCTGPQRPWRYVQREVERLLYERFSLEAADSGDEMPNHVAPGTFPHSSAHRAAG